MRATDNVSRRNQQGLHEAAHIDAHARRSWSGYWGGSAGESPDQAIAHGRFGSVLHQHWKSIFTDPALIPPDGRILDLACGAGTVGRLARDHIAAALPNGINVVGIDYSLPAVRHPLIGLVGDIVRTPFASGCFDCIVSQFGIEYAGQPAFHEAARLLAPSGRFVGVVHAKDGAIWQENASCLDILQCTADAGLIHKSRLRLQIGYKLDRGEVAPAAFMRRTAVFEKAAEAVLIALRNSPDCPAKAYIGILLPDLLDSVARRKNHDPEALYNWLGEQERALDAYAFRMQAMLDAAMDAWAVRDAAGSLVSGGTGDATIGTLSLGSHSVPAAWTVSVRRR